MSKRLSFQCFKWVRSREKEWLEHHGIQACTHELPLGEKEEMLKKKITEEAHEVIQSPNHIHAVSELIDVQEALWALITHWGISKDAWIEMCQEKRNARGSYEEGVLLNRITLPDSHPKALHFQSHPEKYIPVL